MDVQNYRADLIQEYRLQEKVVHGNFKDDVKNYDKQEEYNPLI